jgi:O-antigen/teichoic acid export membrane protein
MEFPVLYLDRILLEQRNDIISFGLYSIGLMFAGYFVTVGSAIFQAFEPDFYKFIGKRQAKKTLLTAALVFGLLLFITILFNIFSSFIVSFLTSNRYPGAHKYADILIWANLLMLFSYFLAIYFVVAGKTKLLLLKQIILCILSVFFLYYAVVNWGFSGAAYARVFINLVNCLILVLFGGIIYWNMKQHMQCKGFQT